MVLYRFMVRFAPALALAIAGSAQAVTFSNVSITPPPLSEGSSWSIDGNSISFFSPSGTCPAER